MPEKLSQTELAAKGVLLLRGMLDRWPKMFGEREALIALCDYTERTIKARAAGGRKTKPEIARANGRKGGRPRKS